MDDEKIYIIGDIHGCAALLEKLMQKIDWRPDVDKLIFIGDYIDRGEDSAGVVDHVIGLLKQSKNVRCLLGNHETNLLNFLDGREVKTFMYNGGDLTLNSYQTKRGDRSGPLIPLEHVDFFKSLETRIELDDYHIVHAGFRPKVEIEDQTLEDMTWIREPFLSSDFDFGKPVIFGHTPFPEPYVMHNKTGIDTGAVFGNKLTCLELPSRTFHSVGA